MGAEHSPILPWIFALLIPLMLYRRFRRLFGRQVLRQSSMVVRMVILSVLGVTLAPFALRSSQFMLCEIVGLGLGLSLAALGASRTRYLMHEGRLCYVPHTYTGIAVSVLFVGRLAYRLVQVYSGAGASMQGLPGAQVVTPLTTGIFFVLIGYYVAYYGSVLYKSKHLTPGDLETPAPPSVSSTEGPARS